MKDIIVVLWCLGVLIIGLALFPQMILLVIFPKLWLLDLITIEWIYLLITDWVLSKLE